MAPGEHGVEEGASVGSIQPRPRTPPQQHDIHNLSTSSSHRLVTISGTQALQNELRRSRGITTTLPGLDASLVPTGRNRPSSGIRPGAVTEIYGPPGVGKTTFAMQLAANVLNSPEPDATVVWLNTGSPLVRCRLNSIFAFYTLPSESDPPSSPPRLRPLDALGFCFHYHELTSLAHLLTLIMHPTALFPPPHTTLLIIDDLSNLIFSSLPQPSPAPAPAPTSTPLATALSKRESTRRIQTVECLSSSLSSLAASRHIAIVVLNKCTTPQKPGSLAMLKSALAGQAWDPGIYARIVLYRDFPPRDVRDKLSEEEQRGYRLAEVVRLGNKDVFRTAVPFLIGDRGLREINVVGIDDGEATPDAEGEDANKTEDAQQPHPNFLATMPSSNAPLIEDEDQDEEEQLVDRAEPESENLGPGLEEEENELRPPTTEETRRAGKRKAIEIADSEDDDDDDDDDQGHSGSEPDLPRILSAREMHDGASQEGEEEMLLDEHERHLHVHAAGDD